MLPPVRIDSNYVPNSPASFSTGAVSSSPSSAASPPIQPGNSESGQDAVQLSQLSSVLNSLATGAASVLQRVSTLSRLVQSGDYQVPSELVAGRIVSDALGAR
jgi:hypothetical protein